MAEFLFYLSLITGNYMYIETSGPGQAGEAAVLESGLYKSSTPSCTLSFWYHMYGSSIGTLSVVVKRTDGSYSTLWQLRDNQGNKWIKTSVNIGSQSNFAVQFKAVRKRGVYGDIAIDDVLFQNCGTGQSCYT